MPLGVISNAGGMEDLEGNLRDMLGGMFQGKKKKRSMKVPDALKHLPRKKRKSSSTWMRWSGRPLRKWSRQASSFWTRSTRSPAVSERWGRMYRGKGCSETCCRLSKGHRQHQTWSRSYRPYSVHRCGCIPCCETVRLIPELQGRFPSVSNWRRSPKTDFIRILTEPRGSLIRQYHALIETEGLRLDSPRMGWMRLRRPRCR